MSVAIYILALLCFVTVLLVRRLAIFSPLVVFVFFCILYSMFPYLAYIDYLPSNIWVLPLLAEKKLIDIHLVNVGLSITAFSLFYGYAIGRPRRKNEVVSLKNNFIPSIPRISRREYILICVYCLIALICFVLGYLYPWSADGDVGRSVLINSLLGNLKIVLAVIIAYFYSRYGFNLNTVYLILALLAITFIEGSRTTFASLMIALLIVESGSEALTKERKFALSILAIVSFFAMILVALLRIDMLDGITSALDALYPLFFEGMYGSYMCLQVYDLVEVRGILPPTWGLHMVFDPIIFLIPRVFFSILGIDKDAITFFSLWKMNADNLLSEPLGPYGGYFYVADAFLTMPYLGPFFISGLFGFITGYIQKRSGNTFLGRYIYSLYLVGFFMVFIKHQISQSTHFLFVTALLGFIVHWSMRLKNSNNRQFLLK